MFNFLRKKKYIKYLPFCIIILFISVSSTIYPPSGYAMTISFIPIICLIFWTLHLGKHLDVFQCFFIGIFTDLLIGSPIGSYLLLFSLVRFLSLRIKDKFQINSFFKNIIAGFVLILVFYIFNNLFFMLYYSTIIFSKYMILNILATIFLYPALAVIFQWTYNILSIEKNYVKT